MFSKACQYAIKVMIFIASNQHGGKRTGLKEMVSFLDTPEAYTAKILQQLVKGGLLQSFRGPSGGFELAHHKVRIYDVVEVIDGRQLMEKCVLGLPNCSGETPCSVHHKFVGIRGKINDTLLEVMIDDPSLMLGAGNKKET